MLCLAVTPHKSYRWISLRHELHYINHWSDSGSTPREQTTDVRIRVLTERHDSARIARQDGIPSGSSLAVS
jgi:hypothetical protein